jgi:hypothetical protein
MLLASLLLGVGVLLALALVAAVAIGFLTREEATAASERSNAGHAGHAGSVAPIAQPPEPPPETASSPEPSEAPVAEVTAAPPVVDPVDLWAGPMPRELARARAALEGGREMRSGTERTLKRYTSRHRDDARGFLLLAHGYYSRGWRPDAIERYERAFEIDPNVRHDQQMRDNLVRLAGHGNVGLQAQRLVRTIYAAEARAHIDRILAEGRLDRDDQQRLIAFRDTL